jgi:hypothetical protein
MSSRFYTINLQQRLDHPTDSQRTTSSARLSIRNAADSLVGLIEDCLLHWRPECFPLIFVSAIFSAMIAYASDHAELSREQLGKKLRPSLLALKQLEECHVIARWIRLLFMDFLERRGDRQDGQSRERTPQPSSRCPPGASDDNRNRMDLVSLAEHAAGDRTTSYTEASAVDGTPTGHRVATYDDTTIITSTGPDDVQRSDGAEATHWDFAHQPLFDSSISEDPTFVDEFFSELPQQGNNASPGCFPSPSTMAYQSIYFLADLGFQRGDSGA